MGLLDDVKESEYYGGNDYGNYQFTSLDNIITQFQIAYVGENKIIPKIKRADIQFFAMRALQELSFDTFKSVKSEEIVVPASLQMILPQDYVNYTKISWVDDSGIKHPLYPTKHTSNPKKYQKDDNNEYLFNISGEKISSGELLKNGNFQGIQEPWILNENGQGQDGNITNSQVVLVGTNSLGSEEPLETATTGTIAAQGWFYGYDGNAVRGYNLLQWQAFRQQNIDEIIPGEKYKITYTISNYSSGEFNFVLSNNLGGIITGTGRTANGTYEETVTTITTGNTTLDSTGNLVKYISNQFWLRNTSATAGNATIDSISIVRVTDEETSTTWSNYKSSTPSENSNDDYEDDDYWSWQGERYGLDPSHSQVNGSFYIDQLAGKIHFSSNISGKTVILDYISDSLGTDAEMQVHKFAEEAMYKHVAHAILSTSSSQIHQQLAPRFKKEKFAAVRQAKLRLSNIKLEEITQILRGKSKQIKH
jgi:hypothetical protein